MMKTIPSFTVATVLLACGTFASAIFLDELALAELAEKEGYALTLHAVQRARRDAEQCPCPPPGGDDGNMPPPPPPAGCWPPPSGPWGPHRGHHQRWGSQSYNGPPCELRALFRIPDRFNFTARTVCFDRWERDSAKEMGLSPEDRFDMSRYKPTHRRSLMWNKGCDMQCHFMENELLEEVDGQSTISWTLVSQAILESEDSDEVVKAVNDAIESCKKQGTEMVHPKQVCQTGADEVLFCLQRTLQEACPGSKWQGHHSCAEIEEPSSKLRTCWNIRRATHPHGPHGPHGPPPPPFFDGRRGPPPHNMRPGGPMGGMEPMSGPDGSWPVQSSQPNTITLDGSAGDKSDASEA